MERAAVFYKNGMIANNHRIVPLYEKVVILRGEYFAGSGGQHYAGRAKRAAILQDWGDRYTDNRSGGRPGCFSRSERQKHYDFTGTGKLRQSRPWISGDQT